MKIKTIASRKTDSRTRNEGSYEAALELTVGEVTGLGYFSQEIDGRDIMGESLFVEKRIADVVRPFIPEEGPSVLDGIFGECKTTGDQNELVRVYDACDVSLFDYS